MYEFGVKVATVDVFGRSAVVDELADILSYAASEVEELFTILETGDYGRVFWLLGDGDVKKFELANARIWELVNHSARLFMP